MVLLLNLPTRGRAPAGLEELPVPSFGCSTSVASEAFLLFPLLSCCCCCRGVNSTVIIFRDRFLSNCSLEHNIDFFHTTENKNECGRENSRCLRGDLKRKVSKELLLSDTLLQHHINDLLILIYILLHLRLISNIKA